MAKQPILICLYAYAPFANANTNVMLPLIKALNEEYEVHMLTENNDNQAPTEEVMADGVIVHRYKKHAAFAARLYTMADYDVKKKRPFHKAFLIRAAATVARCVQRIFPRSEYVFMRKLMKTHDFAFVMTTCESFSSCRNMLRLKKATEFSTPWIAYFMDPYAYFINNRFTDGELLEIETDVYAKADMVLVTEEIYKENHTNAFAPYLYKTHPFRFGNFRCINRELQKDIFVQGKINCVYVGSLLSESIRSPRYFYHIINHMDDRFAFHIVCNHLTEQNKAVFREIVHKTDNVYFHDSLPLDVCMGIISHADVLINLGNKSVNQTPSKVFDYIGTGKPIVNFYSLQDDTSKYYLENYPTKLHVFEDADKIEENALRFTSFAEEFAGKTIPAEILQKNYEAYESEAVTKDTVKLIHACLEKIEK